MIQLKVNGATKQYDGDPEMPLLWYVRDQLQLTGSKFGCGVGLCGACTVHINGDAQRSCVTRMNDVAGKEIITSKGFPLTPIIPCKKRGSMCRFHNAATARVGRSCKRRRC